VIWALLGILLLAVAFDLVFYTGLCASDDLQYINAARQVGVYRTLTRVQPGSVRLMMVLPLAVIMGITHSDLFAMTASFAVWHLLVILLTFWLARTVHGPRTGVIAAGLVAVCPIAVVWAMTIFPDMPVTALSLLGLCLVFAAAKRFPGGPERMRSSLIYLGAGIAVGLAYMVKETAYVLMPFFAVLVLFDTRKAALAQRLIAPGMLALGLLIVLGGETLALSKLAGKPVFRPTMLQSMDELSPEVRSKLERQGTNPLDRFRELEKRDLNDAYFGHFRWAMAAAVFLYPFLRRRSWRLWLLFLWSFGYLCFGTASIHHYFPPSLQPRYLIFPLPMSMALVALLIDSGGVWLWRRASKRLITARLFVIGATLLACATLWHSATRANALAGTLYSSMEISGTRQAVDFALRNSGRVIVVSRWLSARAGPTFYGMDDPRLMRTAADAGPALATQLLDRDGSFLYVGGGNEARQWHAAPPDSDLDLFIQSALAGADQSARVRTVGEFTQFRTRLDGLRYVLGGSLRSGAERATERGVMLYEVTPAPKPGAAVAAPQ
jgi:hypothetical protein